VSNAVSLRARSLIAVNNSVNRNSGNAILGAASEHRSVVSTDGRRFKAPCPHRRSAFGSLVAAPPSQAIFDPPSR
jgi:hypothetical protein